MRRSLRRLFVVLGALACSASCQTVGQAWTPGPARPFDGQLSVMTYNVKGGPWPVAWNRSGDLYAIGERLREMRREGRNPQVVLLQEAFSGDAEEIARHAGYRYVVAGPSTADRNPAPASATDAAFVAGGTWWLGEGTTRLLDSGLLILSDYPLDHVRRVAFPGYACAGLDCLANKGAVMATVRIPGSGKAFDILDTHLNSRHSSLVGDARSLEAYRRQTGILADFIATYRTPGMALIAGGDFNVGKEAARGDALSADLPRWNFGAAVHDALHAVTGARRRVGARIGADTLAVLRRNTDFLFFAPTPGTALAPESLSVPFGLEASGTMLSDHLGYSATFRLGSAPASPG